jgi:hypothetical protein
MPKFVVTTDEGDGTKPAIESIAYPTEKAATDDAQISLSDMAREKLPNGSHAKFNVKVADEAGDEIYAASLTFDAKSGPEARQASEEQAVADDKAADEVAAAIRAIGAVPKS